jgi:hypothetical protein
VLNDCVSIKCSARVDSHLYLIVLLHTDSTMESNMCASSVPNVNIHAYTL